LPTYIPLTLTFYLSSLTSSETPLEELWEVVSRLEVVALKVVGFQEGFLEEFLSRAHEVMRGWKNLRSVYTQLEWQKGKYKLWKDGGEVDNVIVQHTYE
jgi:hypothetical protein